MSKKYSLINSLFLLTAFREAKSAVRGRLFFVVVGILVAVFSLVALSSIVTPAVEAIITAAALGGNLVNFTAIITSFFANATMEAALMYIFWGFLAHRDSDFEQMLAIYGVSRWTRNLTYRINTVILLFILSFFLYCTLVLPGILSSALVPELKVGMIVCIAIQMVLTLIIASVFDSGLAFLLGKAHLPFSRGIKLLMLIAIFAAFFFGYFTDILNSIESRSPVYSLMYVSSFFLLAFIPASGITALHFIAAVAVGGLSCLLFIGLCKVEEPAASNTRSWTLLKRIGFSKGYWSIVSKVIKELARNKDRMANSVCMLLTLVVIKIAFPFIFGPAFQFDSLALFVSFPAINFLYVASREHEMGYLYKTRSVPAWQVVVSGLLAAFVLLVFEIFVLCLFFSINLVFDSLASIATSIIFVGGGSYLLGVVFPINKEHPYSTTFIITLFVVGLVPMMVVLFQFAQTAGIEVSTIQIGLVAAGILFGIFAGQLIKRKLGLR